jgi:hypothetical protein
MGHPDYLHVSSGQVPVFAGNIGTFASGVFGPIDASVLSGGSYLLTVSPQTPANVAITDITVQHLDSLGNVVYTDFFGGTFCGNGDIAILQVPGPVNLRGNIYGITLRISGNRGTAAFSNAVLGTAGLLTTPVILNLYTLPFSIPDPYPKVFTGGALIGSFTGTTPGGLLATFVGTTLTPSTSSVITPLVPYAGPAIMTYYESGVITTPANAQIAILSYTVASGSGTPVAQSNWTAATARISSSFALSLPSALNVAQATNFDGAQTAVFRSNIVGSMAA